MKRKFIVAEEYQKILPEERLIFSTQSLVSSISFPPEGIFMALHGNLNFCGAQGTAYVIRADYNDPVPLNIDAYSFDSRPDKQDIEIMGPVEHEHHWAPDTPVFMKSDIPKEIQAKVEEVISDYQRCTIAKGEGPRIA